MRVTARHLTVALLVAVLLPVVAGAATIVVDTTADSGSGNCTLTEAVAAANTDSAVDACAAGSGADVIDLTGLTGTITLGASLFIPTDVTIQGPGARNLRISGTTAQTIRNDSGATVVIRDVTIADTAGIGSFSGCITPCLGSLTLERVRVTNCTGAPDSDPFPSDAMGPAVATNCTGANLTIVDSTFDDNHLTGGNGADGGAIWWAGVALKIVNTTFSGNTASHDGGALAVLAGSATLDNVTFADNAADGVGDAVMALNTVGQVTVVLRNTVAADSIQGGNCATLNGATITSSYTLSDDATCGVGTGNQMNVAASLGTLANNGGPTDTHLPAPGSPLIDAGDPAGCTDQTGGPLLADQRGITRPQGSRCDVGAVEVVTTTTTTTSTSTTTTTTTTTLASSTTTTSLAAAAACSTIDDCLASLGSTLPASTGAADRKAKRAALRLHRLFTRLGNRLARAQASSARYYRKASRTLGVLVVTAQSAARKGTLGVPLDPLQAAAAALLAKFQS
jgi:predicted outer membrane repeat protein